MIWDIQLWIAMYQMWSYIGLRDFLRIEKTNFYGYGGYEIVNKESSGIIVVTV